MEQLLLWRPILNPSSALTQIELRSSRYYIPALSVSYLTDQSESQNLLAENSDLRANLQSTKSDYDDQLESRRNWQAKARDAEDKLREVAETSVGAPSCTCTGPR